MDTGLLGDGILDELPTGVRLGATRIGGVDLNKPRIRDALRAALALAPAPNGFTVAEFAAKVYAPTGIDHCGYSLRQAGYDLRKLRATPRRQARPNPPLPRPAPGCAHHRRPAHPARPGHHPDPRRGAQPPLDENPRTGHASTVTTNESASICKPSSTTSPSTRR